jgi:hypothetical protein
MSRHESTFPFPDSDTDPEFHTASATAHLLDELALCGHRPGQDEPDPRPLPESDAVHGQLGAMVEAFGGMLTGTRLEDDLADLLWRASFMCWLKAEPSPPSVRSVYSDFEAESPFTDLDPLGVAGVFGEGEVVELL